MLLLPAAQAMAGNLQIGHNAFSCSHGSMHSGWNRWKHGIIRTQPPSSKVLRHTVQLAFSEACNMPSLRQ